ncbi:MAG: hypothetical protein M1608_08905 [Candidatus Omnitrophica bacterium]|nr:hypothetical protein [Candidatus Omnitrophota bacterium]
MYTELLRIPTLESLKTVSEHREKFLHRLLILLSFEKSLGVTSKTFDVMTERERILCESRILTDIRPVFGKPSDRPTAAIIVHNLKIIYHQDGEHHEFYVALDGEDIRTLKGVLERAEKKEQSLQSLMGETGVSCLKEP